jgi:prepilin-type N-terminal cleavage/methylation domain-containing protein
MEQHELETKKNDKGFTLIELLIVIVILGILATVVVFAVGGIRDQADENVCATKKAEVATAAEAYRATVANDADADITMAELLAEQLLTTTTMDLNGTAIDGTSTAADVAAVAC